MSWKVWTPFQFAEWLRANEFMKQFAEKFEAAKIGGSDLEDLDENSLKDFGLGSKLAKKKGFRIIRELVDGTYNADSGAFSGSPLTLGSGMHVTESDR